MLALWHRMDFGFTCFMENNLIEQSIASYSTAILGEYMALWGEPSEPIVYSIMSTSLCNM